MSSSSQGVPGWRAGARDARRRTAPPVHCAGGGDVERAMTTAPLLSVRGVHVHFPGLEGPVRAVDGVDLDLCPGETLALVGESGCGKSSLARALVGLTPVTSGTVRFSGEVLTG